MMSVRSPLLVALSLYVLVGCSGDLPETVSAESLQKLRQRSEVFAGRTAGSLLQEPAALTVGEELYAAHCAACHGPVGGEAERGIPQLATAVLHHGDSEAAIDMTIRSGRLSVMPSFGGEMSEVELGAVVALVRSFSSGEVLANYGETAAEQFGKYCVQCHGAAGEGNVELGIPNLGDDYWLHGESMMNVRLTITGGVEAQCPPQAGVLTDSEIGLLTAYVLQLRSGNGH